MANLASQMHMFQFTTELHKFVQVLNQLQPIILNTLHHLLLFQKKKKSTTCSILFKRNLIELIY